MRFQLVAMTAPAAHAIAAWTHPPPYTLYNHEPARRESVAQALLDPTHRFSAITEASNELVGFCCLGANAQVLGGDYEQPATDIGVGMRPDLTGLGHGGGLLEAVLNHAQADRPGATLRVTIAAFNARALRVWETAGFRERSRFVRPSDDLAFRILISGHPYLIQGVGGGAP